MTWKHPPRRARRYRAAPIIAIAAALAIYVLLIAAYISVQAVQAISAALDAAHYECPTPGC